MATRWYFQSSGATAVAHAYSASWGDTTIDTRRPMDVVRAGTAAVNHEAGGNGVGTRNVLLGQFVSAPLAAQTVSGTVKGQFLARELDAGVNATSQLVARIIAADGTVRGTLVAAHSEAVSSEWPVTPAANRKLPLAALSPLTVTPVVVVAGDRLIIEVGARSGDDGIEVVRLVIQDDQVADLAENETATGAANPWIEFSHDFSFPGATTHAGAGAISAGLSVGI